MTRALNGELMVAGFPSFTSGRGGYNLMRLRTRLGHSPEDRGSQKAL